MVRKNQNNKTNIASHLSCLIGKKYRLTTSAPVISLWSGCKSRQFHHHPFAPGIGRIDHIFTEVARYLATTEQSVNDNFRGNVGPGEPLVIWISLKHLHYWPFRATRSRRFPLACADVRKVSMSDQTNPADEIPWKPDPRLSWATQSFRGTCVLPHNRSFALIDHQTSSIDDTFPIRQSYAGASAGLCFNVRVHM